MAKKKKKEDVNTEGQEIIKDNYEPKFEAPDYYDQKVALIERPRITAATKLMKNSGFKKASEIDQAQYIPTGSYQFDHARGLEHAVGFKRGSTVVIYGEPGAGKSTEAYSMIGFWQSIGLQVALMNLEDSFDQTWAAKQGVDIDKLFITEVPKFMDEALQQALDAMEGNYFDVLVMDSLHAVGTKREIDRTKTLENEKPVAALAGKITQFLRVAKPYMHSSKTLNLVIGHARMDVNAGPMARGPQIMLTGGEHLQHESHDIFQVTKSVSKTRAPWVNDQLIGHAMGVFVEKCRGPGIRARFDEIFIKDKGFREAWVIVPKALADKNVATEVLKQSGYRYTWTDKTGEEHTLNGKQALIDWFDDRPDETKRLWAAYDKSQKNQKTQEVSVSVEGIQPETEE